MATEKLNKRNPVFDQIPEEIIKGGCGTIRFGIHIHFNSISNSIWNKEELPEQWEGVDHCTY